MLYYILLTTVILILLTLYFWNRKSEKCHSIEAPIISSQILSNEEKPQNNENNKDVNKIKPTVETNDISDQTVVSQKKNKSNNSRKKKNSTKQPDSVKTSSSEVEEIVKHNKHHDDTEDSKSMKAKFTEYQQHISSLKSELELVFEIKEKMATQMTKKEQLLEKSNKKCNELEAQLSELMVSDNENCEFLKRNEAKFVQHQETIERLLAENGKLNLTVMEMKELEKKYEDILATQTQLNEDKVKLEKMVALKQDEVNKSSLEKQKLLEQKKNQEKEKKDLLSQLNEMKMDMTKKMTDIETLSTNLCSSDSEKLELKEKTDILMSSLKDDGEKYKKLEKELIVVRDQMTRSEEELEMVKKQLEKGSQHQQDVIDLQAQLRKSEEQMELMKKKLEASYEQENKLMLLRSQLSKSEEHVNELKKSVNEVELMRQKIAEFHQQKEELEFTRSQLKDMENQMNVLVQQMDVNSTQPEIVADVEKPLLASALPDRNIEDIDKDNQLEDVDKLKKHINVLETEFRNIQGQLFNMKRTNKDLEAQLKQSTTETQNIPDSTIQDGTNEKINNLEQNLAENSLELKMTLSRNEELTQTLATVLKEKTNLEHQKHSLSASTKTLSAELDAKKGQIATLYTCLENIDNRLIKISNSAQIQFQQCEQIESMKAKNLQLSQLHKEIEIKFQELTKRNEELHNIVKSASKTEELDILKQLNESLTNDNEQLTNQLSHYKSTLIKTETLLKDIQSSVESEESKWRLALSQSESYSNELKEMEKKIEQLRSENINLKDKLETTLSETSKESIIRININGLQSNVNELNGDDLLVNPDAIGEDAAKKKKRRKRKNRKNRKKKRNGTMSQSNELTTSVENGN